MIQRSLLRRLVDATAPWQIVTVVFLLAYAAAWLPPFWNNVVRLVNGFSILVMLGQGFVQYGKQARISRDENRLGREELRTHRDDIIAGMKKREDDLVGLRAAASALAKETVRIAADLAEENRRLAEASTAKIAALGVQTAEALSRETVRIATELADDNRRLADESTVKITALSAQIAAGNQHAQNAYDAAKAAVHEANSVNTKIDEQQKALESLNKRLIEQGDLHHNEEQVLQTIDRTTKESHQILTENVLNRAKATQLDTMQTTGEDSNAILRKKKVTT